MRMRRRTRTGALEHWSAESAPCITSACLPARTSPSSSRKHRKKPDPCRMIPSNTCATPTFWIFSTCRIKPGRKAIWNRASPPTCSSFFWRRARAVLFALKQKMKSTLPHIKSLTMIKLHHLEYSRSFRILWALEELGADYQLVNYQRRKNLAAPAELKTVHPLGKAPILEDDGEVIAESAVILDYLQSRFDPDQRFKPTDSKLLTFALLGLQEIPGLPDMPNIRRFLQQMMARDAYVSACRKSPDGGRVTR